MRFARFAIAGLMQPIASAAAAVLLTMIGGLLPQDTKAVGGTVASIEVRNPSDRSLRGVPVTFGQVFKKGGVPRGEQVHCLVDGRWAGNIRYDASIVIGGNEVFAARAVDHRPLSRWRKVFWWGGSEPARSWSSTRIGRS